MINNHDKKTLCFGSIKKGEIFTIKETRNIYETWSKTFSSESDLAVAISNIEKTKIQIVQNTVNPMCAGLNYSFKNEFTQIHRQVSAHFIRLDEDDFYEHYFYLKYMNDLKTILEKMTENQGIEQYMPELKPIIDYLESLVYKYETTLISQKMAAASYYNIGLIYYYLDMPEETLL
ncbi:MAG: hypothetical protein LBP63_08475 [Prevotellaceae bacterium]|nr:hypothetical protein [Prevotellaceae bacterium]